jgi:transcriptional regulator with XRE-family HTH domain
VDFGEKIRKYRLDRGLTQAGLAEMLGSTREKIQKYENGVNEPSFEMVIKLADTFQVCVDQLLRNKWSCPLNYPATASIAQKMSQLSFKEIQAVNKLIDELTLVNGEED